ncbi:MAG: conserved hypothetical protein [Methanobrevibacter sp. CfCl-M3]
MNFKAIFLIAILVFSSLSMSSATYFCFDADGCSHLFTSDLTGPGVNFHWVDDVKGTKEAEHDVPLVLGETYHITINSKAWRDFGGFRYGWEKTGTTKSWDFVYDEPANHNTRRFYIVETKRDTLFNGVHLTFAPSAY